MFKYPIDKAQGVEDNNSKSMAVEDLIQEAMSKGDFDNLAGYGKPLNVNPLNPYVNFTENKINKILLDNGFRPEWITLQKQIREQLENLQRSLCKDRDADGDVIMGDVENAKWQRLIERYQCNVDDINEKIDKFNILVPILSKQIVRIRLDRIAVKIHRVDRTTTLKIDYVHNTFKEKPSSSVGCGDEKKDFFSFISSIFY